jgi:hypothetical protein
MTIFKKKTVQYVVRYLQNKAGLIRLVFLSIYLYYRPGPFAGGKGIGDGRKN